MRISIGIYIRECDLIACSSKFELFDGTQCVPNGIGCHLKIIQLKNLQNSQENLRKGAKIHSLLPTVYELISAFKVGMDSVVYQNRRIDILDAIDFYLAVPSWHRKQTISWF